MGNLSKHSGSATELVRTGQNNQVGLVGGILMTTVAVVGFGIKVMAEMSRNNK